MKTIYVVSCWRAGANEYPICAFSSQEQADICAGYWNRNSRPLVNYRVSPVTLDPVRAIEALRVVGGAG